MGMLLYKVDIRFPDIANKLKAGIVARKNPGKPVIEDARSAPRYGHIQLVFAFEIEVKRALAQFGLPGDLLHGRLFDSSGENDFFRGVDNTIIPLLPFSFFSFLCAHKLIYPY